MSKYIPPHKRIKNILPKIIAYNDCKGFIIMENKGIYNRKLIITKDILKSHNELELLDNINIKNCISKYKNCKLNFKKKLDKDFFEHIKHATYYTGYSDNIRHNVIIYEYNSNDIPSKIKKIIDDKKTYVCPINKDYAIANTGISNYTKYILETKNIQYLDKINGKEFYDIHDMHVIMPDFYKYPITTSDINLLYELNKIGDQSAIHEFLYNIHFVMYLKKYNGNINKFLNNRNTLIDDLEIAKTTIYKFYNKLGLDIIDKEMVLISLYTDIKNGPLLIKFYLMNIFKSYTYTSFIEYFKTLKIDFVIQLLKSGQDIPYYKRFNIDDEDIDKYCSDNYFYLNDKSEKKYSYTPIKKKNIIKDNFYNKRLSDIIKGKKGDCYIKQVCGKKLDEFDDMGYNDYKIVVEETHYKNINTRGYCQIFLLISLYKDEIKKTIYEIGIKTLTYNYLVNKEDWNFSKKFYNILNSLNKNDIIERQKETNYIKTEYVKNLPAIFEIKLVKKNRYLFPLRIFLKESSDQYWNDTLYKIKQTLPDCTIILKMVYLNILYKRIENIESDKLIKLIENSMDKHPWLKIVRKHFLNKNVGLYSENKNFLISKKVIYDDLYTDGKYILWYFPKITIKKNKINNFIDLLMKIIKDGNDEIIITEKNQKKIYTRIYNSSLYKDNMGNVKDIESIDGINILRKLDSSFRYKYNDDFINCTDIKDIYNDINFIHNYKHLKKEHKTEISNLLIKFYDTVAFKPYQKIKKQYYELCNYPNHKKYNIFHMQLVNPIYDIKFDYVSFDPIHFNYVNPTMSRAVKWDYIRIYDYKRIDSILHYDTQINKNDNIDKISEQFKKDIKIMMNRGERNFEYFTVQIPKKDKIKYIINNLY